MKIYALVLAAVLSAGCVRSFQPLRFPARYQPALSSFPSVPPCAAASGLQVLDGRPAGTPEGWRYQEERPQDQKPIRMDGTADWLEDGVSSALGRARISTATAGKPELVATLTRLELEEKHFSNSTYNGRAVLDVELRSGNTSCWRGRAEGGASHYGMPQSADNLREMANEALDNAVSMLVTDSAFQDAACTCVAGAGTGAKGL